MEISESIPDGEDELWSRFWERCEAVVHSEFGRVGRALPLNWASGGGQYSHGFRGYAEFGRVGSGAPLPNAGSMQQAIGRAFIESAGREDFRGDAKITVIIELNDSQIRYDADLQAAGQIVRRGPSNVVKCPATEAGLTDALERILGEIVQFIRDCKDRVLDLVS